MDVILKHRVFSSFFSFPLYTSFLIHLYLRCIYHFLRYRLQKPKREIKKDFSYNYEATQTDDITFEYHMNRKNMFYSTIYIQRTRGNKTKPKKTSTNVSNTSTRRYWLTISCIYLNIRQLFLGFLFLKNWYGELLLFLQFTTHSYLFKTDYLRIWIKLTSSVEQWRFGKSIQLWIDWKIVVDKRYFQFFLYLICGRSRFIKKLPSTVDRKTFKLFQLRTNLKRVWFKITTSVLTG